MKDLVKILYQGKIWITVRFNWGFNEISTYWDFVKNIGLFLTVSKLLFGFVFSIYFSAFIGLIAFLSLVVLGIILEKTNMLKFATQEINRQNPQMNKIDEIHKSLIK